MSMKSDRLRHARQQAGFAKAAEATDRFEWAYSTYAGHENGSRDFDDTQAQRYARAFKVTPEWLLFGKGKGASAPSTPPKPLQANGFSEPAVESWQGAESSAGRNLIEGLAPNAKTPSAFKLRRAIHELFLDKGDILIIDLKATPTAGNVVVATKIDVELASAETVLGRLLPPYLVPPNHSQAPILIDNSLAIMGPVIASFRSKAGI